MSFWQTIRVAVRALGRNKMRSSLTTLGIIIGVAAVIAMVAIGEGAKKRVEEAFASMGTNLLVLMSGASSSGGMRGGFGSQPTLTWDDFRAIQSEISTVKAAAPGLNSRTSVLSEDQNWSTTVTGTSPDYFDIRSWAMQKGAAFTQSDVEAGNKVAILGQTVVEKLYGPNADPVGHQIRIKNVPFQVIGVADKKGQSQWGQDYDDVVFVPYSTFLSKVQGGLKNYLTGVIFVGTAAGATSRAEREIANLLRERHRIGPGSEDDFSIRNLTEMAAAQQEGTNTMTSLLAAIAFVSLLVGGIGIMNIMLVSVTERTREIGLRLAVGAKGYDILVQFLVEALVLATLGGLIGVGIGVGVAAKLAQSFGWAMLMRPDIMFISVGFSAVVGIVFGLYPAWKASRLDPIEALRYE